MLLFLLGDNLLGSQPKWSWPRPQELKMSSGNRHLSGWGVSSLHKLAALRREIHREKIPGRGQTAPTGSAQSTGLPAANFLLVFLQFRDRWDFKRKAWMAKGRNTGQAWGENKQAKQKEEKKSCLNISESIWKTSPVPVLLHFFGHQTGFGKMQRSELVTKLLLFLRDVPLQRDMEWDMHMDWLQQHAPGLGWAPSLSWNWQWPFYCEKTCRIYVGQCHHAWPRALQLMLRSVMLQALER